MREKRTSKQTKTFKFSLRMLKGTLLMIVQELMAKSAIELKSGSRKDQVLNSESL